MQYIKHIYGYNLLIVSYCIYIFEKLYPKSSLLQEQGTEAILFAINIPRVNISITKICVSPIKALL